MERTWPFIFFLTLEDRLPDQFYAFDLLFKESGYTLVPVKVDQLQQLVAMTEQNHVMVISCVSSFKQFRLFNERVRHILKYVLKSRRLFFFNLSSFSKLNDTRIHGIRKNYFFVKNPIDARVFAKRIVGFYEQKSSQSELWPGRPRPQAQGVA